MSTPNMKLRFNAINTMFDLALSEGKALGVQFKTKDGRVRNMNVRPCPIEFRTKEQFGVNLSVDGIQQLPNHPNLRTVWDHRAEAFRNMNLATVKLVNVGGTRYTIANVDVGAV